MKAPHRRARVVLMAILAAAGLAVTVAAQESVNITLPAMISFQVTDVTANTTGSPNPTAVSFSGALLQSQHALRISVKADSDFVPMSGPAIAASNVSWVTSNASNGAGTNGTLSTGAWGQVFEGNVSATSGSVDIVWTLAAPGASVRAGAHDLTLRWKLESIVP